MQLKEQKADGSIHTELRGSPYSYAENIEGDISYKDIILAIQKGIDEAKEKLGISSTFIACFSRQKYEKYGQKVIETTLNLFKQGILIGIDIAGGPENQYPPDIFQNLLKPVYCAGVPITIHAGEQGTFPEYEDCPPQFINSAILKLHTNRIGHGTSIIADKTKFTIDLIKKMGVCIECCPVGNELLGYTPMKDHPIKFLLENEINATMSTDDPLMFGVQSVNEIYTRYSSILGITEEDMINMTRIGIENSFIKDEYKQQLKKEIF